MRLQLSSWDTAPLGCPALEHETCWSLAYGLDCPIGNRCSGCYAPRLGTPPQVRDVRGWLAEDPGQDDGVLVVHETGSPGRNRLGRSATQHTGTVGRIENRQVAGFLAYGPPHGRG